METWKEAYLKLQNGSDVRGVALESAVGGGGEPEPRISCAILPAFAEYLMDKKEDGVLRVGVGHDSRLSAQGIKKRGLNGLGRRGCRVYDCGLTSTPSMFMSTVLEGFEYDGAVMITASHPAAQPERP